MNRKRNYHSITVPPPAKVAIWMPFPDAIGNAGAVVGCLIDICMTADRQRLGLPLKQERCGQMDYGRSRACMEAMYQGFTHVLMLDADHRHGPPDLVARLMAHDKDVVGSLNFARGDGRPCAIPIDGSPIAAGQGLVRCFAIGTGALMIRLACLEKMAQPWFYMPYGACENLSAAQWPGEDGGFSINCQRAGIEIWCDTDLNSPHATTKWI